jgi:N-acetyl sugar amidotransferase
MKKCNNCLLPETHETINFDTLGKCNICSQHEYKNEKIDWSVKEKKLLEIVSHYKGKKSFDCIVPFSGGKDSVFTLWYLKKKLNLRCLVISFDHDFYRPNLIASREKIINKLGVDFLTYKPNWDLTKKLMLESLIRKGDFCWHCHSGIFSYPMQIAVKFDIPLIIWGETQAEYAAYYTYEDTDKEREIVDEERFNRFVNLGISSDDMKEMINDNTIDPREFDVYKYPSKEELESINFTSICLGSYIPWDVKKQVKIIKEELDWIPDLNAGIPEEYSYEKVECQVQGIRDYIKFLKRGYSRSSHLVALDLRNKRIDHESAKQIISKFDGKKPEALNHFLNIMNISENEFNNIIMRHVVYPNKINFNIIEEGPKLHDKDLWLSKTPLSREYTKQKLKDFNI